MLHDLITTELRVAFGDMLKDAYKPFVLTRTTYTYDKRTDINIEHVETFPGHGVFGNFQTEDIDGTNILRTDISLFILRDDFGTKPQEGDIISGYRVAGVAADPADVGYTLTLRGTNGLEQK